MAPGDARRGSRARRRGGAGGSDPPRSRRDHRLLLRGDPLRSRGARPRGTRGGQPRATARRGAYRGGLRGLRRAARHVHKGATSQDILDTAAMLVARRALDLILFELDGISRACARLAEEHRETMMSGRTLLQQALPTTFGLKAARWLVAVLEGRRRLLEVRDLGSRPSSAGPQGRSPPSENPASRTRRVHAGAGARPDEPTVPWHTDRTRTAEIGGALSLVAGVLGKISLDVILMAQTEVGEVAEPAGERRGGSSTLPHKRNPILSVTAAANARRVQALAQTLYRLRSASTSAQPAPGTPSGSRSPTPSP